ncbi:hypothetical protein [Clostridium botulinum]|nr:hypothetical protein [Clostridium botulinum]
MNYFKHLKANLSISKKCFKIIMHELGDMLEHLIHGIFPFLGWKH